MGTNYYHESEPCPHCGDVKHRKHIGKSSAGWCFSLHVDYAGEDGVHSLEDWKREFAKAGTRIVDEYGDTRTAAEMLDTITNRSWTPSIHRYVGYASRADFHRSNESQDGPFGLLRHKLGGRCVGHGEGTYDLITGEFS